MPHFKSFYRYGEFYFFKKNIQISLEKTDVNVDERLGTLNNCHLGKGEEIKRQ